MGEACPPMLAARAMAMMRAREKTDLGGSSLVIGCMVRLEFNRLIKFAHLDEGIA